MCDNLKIISEKFDDNNLDIIEDTKDLFPYKLDDFQKWSCWCIKNNHNILTLAPTGSGKTCPIVYGIHCALAKNKKVVLCNPIKALSNQKFNDFKEIFGPDNIGILTGDIKFNPTASCIIATTEIVRNIIYQDTDYLKLEEIDTIIFDEAHYINDLDRGHVWEETLILLPKHINLILLSATINKPENFGEWLANLKNKETYLIQKKDRVVPLTYYYYLNDSLIEFGNSNKDFKNYSMIKDNYKKVNIKKLLNPTIEYLQKNDKLPCLFFLFSRNKCEEYANLITKNLLTTEQSANVLNIFDNKLAPYKKLYEKTAQYNNLRKTLAKGIGYHHSGLIPILKEVVEILLDKGLILLNFCTETFAVGFNCKIKTVLLTSLEKYSNNGFRYLYTHEALQIMGRAGRRGYDKFGTVIILPINDLPSYDDLKKITCGNSQTIESKFYYTYQFILKIINSPNINLNNFIDTSLYNIDVIKNIKNNNYELDILSEKNETINLSNDMYNKIEEYERNQEIIENKLIKIKPKKLQAIKKTNKIISEDEDFKKNYDLYKVAKDTRIKIEKLKDDLYYLKNYNNIEINNIIDFLLKNDYITFNNNHNIWHKIDKSLYMNNYNDMILNVKGLIAENINECNCILLTEIIMNKYLEKHTVEEILGILCIFIEEKTEYDVYINDLDIPDNMHETIKDIQNLSNKYENSEKSSLVDIKTDWNIYLSFIEPGYMWASMKNIHTIYNYSNIYEGNFIKNIIKLNNICENIKNICEIIKNYDLLKKMEKTEEILIREQVTLESLYIK